ncbi:hypothetical protein ACFPPA_05770 [Rhodanobacter ginsengisoli]|uniref:Uncharacterized protein n=1 Tax=Rhodanobacter ginsengisoli TaxID=418646 RepID=A0ABW0QM26_9GAMM
MAEILEQRTTCMLQVNTSGSWRNVLTFDPSRRAAIIAGLAGLASILGDGTTWCIHHPDGKREWLHAEDFAVAPSWQPVTADQPPALQDVMVSAYAPDDKVPHTFMAWRGTTPGGLKVWMLSGVDCEELRMEVYAFAPIIEPAPMPTQQVAA